MIRPAMICSLMVFATPALAANATDAEPHFSQSMKHCQVEATRAIPENSALTEQRTQFWHHYYECMGSAGYSYTDSSHGLTHAQLMRDLHEQDTTQLLLFGPY